jgi:hypothetical protein
VLPLEERQRDLAFLKHRWSPALQHQSLPRDLPLGFHPTEALRTPAQPSISRTATSDAVRRPAAGSAAGTHRSGRVGTSVVMRQAEAEPGSGHAGTSTRPSREWSSEADARSDRMSEAGPGSGHASTRSLRVWSSEADGDSDRDDSDLDDGGFSDLPASLRDIGEDGEPYPGSIADPEDAADLIGNDDELEETSGLDGDASFEIFWNVQVSSQLLPPSRYEYSSGIYSRRVTLTAASSGTSASTLPPATLCATGSATLSGGVATSKKSR